ncbi:Dipeptide transport system permease protein DppC (TC 3.A.1.5.2) [[Actinomadura] parvosata subsp. kistnae]|uniref:Peptide ABC transporter permease n=2 Tax=Nonomuraea TaxID=83681 RepID=A0A1U9ZTC9_9ACTN|nr:MULTISPECIES: ABC transporter permease [unclassified Nonomuraea]AQZ61206.1 peptide ABC transporter permease [Nonomuraea sp. ATCC 55076]NJP97526.1 ABC transporter permease [Nonomuraea sp. FMUSA5-5]SPL97838.1 Dipeptide transport system permease protein DppC (TC 3.A.1.5.2) [Actinomadura parvosata subsp. kistnae]
MTVAAHPEQVAGPAPATSGRRVIRVLLRDRGAVLSGAYLALIVLMAIGAPLISAITGHGPNDFDTAAVNTDLGGVPYGSLGGISSEHLLGVEPQNGRDILARIAYGARVSLIIAVSATALTTLLGVVLGMLAGFYQGWADQVICRVMDFLMAFPALIFMIAILSALPQGNRPVLLVVVISVFGWPYLARVVRGQTMTLVNREFVEAARASGASTGQLVFKEILPNLRSSLIVMTTLAVPGYVGTEAGLSFLGVGVTPPTPSWGQMIASSVGWYAVDPMYFVIPGAFLFLTVLSLTVLGDRIRAAFDAGEAS